MNRTERICVFFSAGHDFAKAVKNVRARHPGAHITAIAPPDFPMDYVDADQVVRMEVDRYRPWHIARVRRLARQLKGGGYDRFIVLFPSVKLKMLAAASGAARAECWGVDGRVQKLEPGLLRNLAGEIPRRIYGLTLLCKIWAQTLRPVRKHKN